MTPEEHRGLIARMPVELKKIRDRMENVQGSWDGDLPGSAEDRAEAAGDIIAQIDSLAIALEDFEDL